jgi:hypothetical protein
MSVQWRDFLLAVTLAVATLTSASAEQWRPQLGHPKAASKAPYPSRISRASGPIRFPVLSRSHRGRLR